jgi:hypothetical protein
MDLQQKSDGTGTRGRWAGAVSAFRAVQLRRVLGTTAAGARLGWRCSVSGRWAHCCRLGLAGLAVLAGS